MCIIAIKPKNTILQDKSILENCFNNNKDGAGYMFTDDNNDVIIKKGYMDFNTFYNELIRDYKNHNLLSKNLVMHFRIGTSGQSKLGCTHPFVITDDYQQLELTRNKTNIGVCHNGIIRQFNDYSAKHSDTEIYIATVLTPLVRLNLNCYKFTDVQNLILKTTESKWTILDRTGEVTTIGNFVKDGEYIYSNTTYKKVEYKPYNWGGYYDIYDYDDKETLDDASDYWYKTYNKTFALDTHTRVEKKPKVKKDKRYNLLHKGNVVLSNDVDYIEVKEEAQYFFDSKYNLYEKVADKQFSLVGTEVIMYTDDTFTTRIEFVK